MKGVVMKGYLEVCTMHLKAWNANAEAWQRVHFVEVLEELKSFARDICDLDVFETCCDSCDKTASDSQLELRRMRLRSAAYAEVGNDVILPWEDIE